jgi:hypothetical protein
MPGFRYLGRGDLVPASAANLKASVPRDWCGERCDLTAGGEGLDASKKWTRPQLHWLEIARSPTVGPEGVGTAGRFGHDCTAGSIILSLPCAQMGARLARLTRAFAESCSPDETPATVANTSSDTTIRSADPYACALRVDSLSERGWTLGGKRAAKDRTLSCRSWYNRQWGGTGSCGHANEAYRIGYYRNAKCASRLLDDVGYDPLNRCASIAL